MRHAEALCEKPPLLPSKVRGGAESPTPAESRRGQYPAGAQVTPIYNTLVYWVQEASTIDGYPRV